MVVCEFREERRNGSAGRTPVSVEVDDDVFAGFQSGLDVDRGVNFCNFARGFWDGGAVCEDGLVGLVDFQIEIYETSERENGWLWNTGIEVPPKSVLVVCWKRMVLLDSKCAQEWNIILFNLQAQGRE